MDDLYLSRLQWPVTTGTAQPYYPDQSASPQAANENTPSFKELLRQNLNAAGGVEFSKHAANRVAERSIPLDTQRLERLNAGVKMAQEKGLDDALILIDRTAFIVSAQHNKVITTLGESDLTGNVFTNIDGTVIV